MDGQKRMNESAILAQAMNEEERALIKRWINNISRVDQRNQCVTTPFVDPGQQGLIKIICQSAQVNYFLSGGFKQAERQRFFIYPASWGELEEEIVCVVRIVTSKFSKPLSHRDYLGSLLGLGLERSVIGDIVVVEDGCYVAIANDIQTFIVQELVTVGSESVSVERVEQSTLENISKNEAFNYQRTTVSSVRLDSVIAAACKMSRSQAQLLIKQGKVKVNHREAANASQTMEPNTLLSVRGKGRIHLKEIQGETRKGRVGIVIGRIGEKK